MLSMKGLELSRKYYEECGREMLSRQFPAYVGRIAVGLAGEGSECFGFDDELSRDHDFGAGFCLWLTKDDFDAVGAEIDAAFGELPSPFLGYERRNIYSGNGDKRIGAFAIQDFYRRFTGLTHAPHTLGEWLAMPEAYLATCVNGEVFCDPLGAFTEMRNDILAYYPEDIRLKKLAVRVGRMAQSGQYNYPRSIRRGETVAAFHALADFLENTESAIYLLNKRYCPFYKWAHRGMENLPRLPRVFSLLEELVSKTNLDIARATAAENQIEIICASVASELSAQGVTDAQDSFLLAHAESIREHICHDALRAMPLFAE